MDESTDKLNPRVLVFKLHTGRLVPSELKHEGDFPIYQDPNLFVTLYRLETFEKFRLNLLSVEQYFVADRKDLVKGGSVLFTPGNNRGGLNG